MSSVFTFSRLQCLQSLHFKTSMSSVFTFQDFNAFCLLHFKTSMSSVFTFTRLQCLLSFTFQDFNVFNLYISRLQCLLFCCARLQLFCLILLILHVDTFILFTGFMSLVFTSCRSDSKIAWMKSMSLSLITFSFSIKDK